MDISGDVVMYAQITAIRVPLNQMEQLRKVRIEKAKRMLRETNEAVLTIASLCGFHSSPSFCRTFAVSTGMTPKQFRVQSVSASSR